MYDSTEYEANQSMGNDDGTLLHSAHYRYPFQSPKSWHHCTVRGDLSNRAQMFWKRNKDMLRPDLPICQDVRVSLRRICTALCGGMRCEVNCAALAPLLACADPRYAFEKVVLLLWFLHWELRNTVIPHPTGKGLGRGKQSAKSAKSASSATVVERSPMVGGSACAGNPWKSFFPGKISRIVAIRGN